MADDSAGGGYRHDVPEDGRLSTGRQRDRRGIRTFSAGYQVNVYNQGIFADIRQEEWQSAFRRGCRELAEWMPEVDAVALSGTTPGLTAMDADGEARLPAILMLDQRSRPQAADIIARIGLGACSGDGQHARGGGMLPGEHSLDQGQRAGPFSGRPVSATPTPTSPGGSPGACHRPVVRLPHRAVQHHHKRPHVERRYRLGDRHRARPAAAPHPVGSQRGTGARSGGRELGLAGGRR